MANVNPFRDSICLSMFIVNSCFLPILYHDLTWQFPGQSNGQGDGNPDDINPLKYKELTSDQSGIFSENRELIIRLYF